MLLFGVCCVLLVISCVVLFAVVVPCLLLFVIVRCWRCVLLSCVVDCCFGVVA